MLRVNSTRVATFARDWPRNFLLCCGEQSRFAVVSCFCTGTVSAQDVHSLHTMLDNTGGQLLENGTFMDDNVPIRCAHIADYRWMMESLYSLFAMTNRLARTDPCLAEVKLPPK